MYKKILTLLCPINKPTIIELNYITRVYLYIKNSKFLNNKIDMIIFDDTPENKFKDYFDKLDINIYNYKKKLLKNRILKYSLNNINSNFIKFFDPDDYLILEWLEKLINKLEKLKDYDYIFHEYYFFTDKKIKKKKNHTIKFLNYNTIYSTDKLKKYQNLLDVNILYTQDQYLGMVADLNSKYKKIKIPFYIYNRNSKTSIWNNVWKNKDQNDRNKIFSDAKLNISFYKNYQNQLTRKIKPRFIRSILLKEKFNNKLAAYNYIIKNLKPKKIFIKLWIIYAIFLKYGWF